MALPKFFLVGTAVVFASIGVMALLKKKEDRAPTIAENPVALVEEVPLATALQQPPQPVEIPLAQPVLEARSNDDVLPEADRVGRLFALDSSKLPIVETLSYTSRVPWLKGRPAWIADYATYYTTSRHFIARSLNRKADYFTQKVSPGDRFNVLKKDKEIQFYLLIDLSRCKLWFYYLDLQSNERVLLKTYRVGLGRLDSKMASKCLTPKGKYELGSKIAIYKPGTMGFYQDEKIEMVRVFGTRWIPFDKELESCTESARGFGIHGAPWSVDAATGQYTEEVGKIGKYESDGCIRLASQDMEELFAIIITKPTVVEIVEDFYDAKLPGQEKQP